jgi:pimeloyl-ACP methyl ester carboxylesterase
LNINHKLKHRVFKSQELVQNTQWLLCFYGYGQSEQVFLDLHHITKNKYSILIIHLPYETTETAWDKDFFANEVSSLLIVYGIKSFTIVSFSLGSRLGLCLIEKIPEKVNTLILLAPDGIKMGFWNTLAVNSHVGKLIFRKLIFSNSLLPNMLKLFLRLKLIPQTLYAFSAWHIRNTNERQRLFHTWLNLKNMIPNLLKINEVYKIYRFPIIAYFGEHDIVIDTQCHKKLARQIPSTKIIMRNKGHNLMDKDLFADIATYLQ